MGKFIKTSINDFISEKIITFNPHKFNSFEELTENDLFDISKWGLELGYSSGAWDDADTLEEAIGNVMDSFKLLLKDKFPDGFKDTPDIITAYRMVVLESPSDLNEKNLGYSWFTNINRIHNPEFKSQLFHLKTKNLYLITALIPLSNVDISRSLLQRDMIWIENEIVLKDDSDIEIISLDKI